MRTEVAFLLTIPVPFTAVEDYSGLGIEMSVRDGKLTELRTVVDHDAGVGQEELILKGRMAVESLLTLTEFASGLHVDVSAARTRELVPRSEVSSVVRSFTADGVVVRLVAMPPQSAVANLTEATRRQLHWYLIAQNSQSPIDRIKNYFKVLEQEEELTKGCSKTYKPPDEAKKLRDAVSHPTLRNDAYLQMHLHSNNIDPRNDSHIRFLESKVPILQSAAQEILDEKIPKWW